MKKILKILRNQAIDSSDQKLIDAMRNEVKSEKLNAPFNSEFKISSVTQDSPISYSKKESRTKPYQIKLIYGVGFACIVITFLSILPLSKLRLFIPGEQEKLNRQLQVWNDIKELQTEIQTSLSLYRKNLSLDNYAVKKINWNDSLPGFEALMSLSEIKNEFMHISPFYDLDLPNHEDFDFLYQKEWSLIKENLIDLKNETSPKKS